jgi:hypothetical protein
MFSTFLNSRLFAVFCQQLIESLPAVFRTVMKRYNLAAGDFPDIVDFQAKLAEQDFSKFAALKQRLIDTSEEVLGVDLPRLMEALPRPIDSISSTLASAAADAAGPLQFATAPPPPPQQTQQQQQMHANAMFAATGSAVPMASAHPGGQEEDDVNPWGDDTGGEGAVGEWALQEYVPQYKPQFDQLQRGGFVSGAAAKGMLQATGLPTAKLRQVWNLSDLDRDGQLDLQEFTIAMYLTSAAQQGQELPPRLDDVMVPPGKTQH